MQGSKDVYLIKEAWAKIVGPENCTHTQVVSFKNGVLTVQVKDAMLYSIYATQQKMNLLRQMQKQMPQMQIKRLHFRYSIEH